MSVRNITRKENMYTNPWATGLLEFPKEKDGVIYVRQSSLTQQQTNVHSFEMQTDKFVEHFRKMGCTGQIEIVPDDEAMSGTLDIHKMPGLSRIVRLIEEEGGERLGWIGAVHVNRLTRDPWLIKPGILMQKCHDHNVWISTLRMHFNFKDEYCQRVFMLEAEEAARHLKWMKIVLGGGKSTASDHGYYDGRYITPGYIVDRTDPQRKKYIIYRPHAEIVFWLFKRFFELDGDFPQLCREVEQMPYVFPKFEDWVDPKTISRFSLHRTKRGNRTEEGDYKLYRHGLESILTNPVYIGWWIPQDGGVIEKNHEPIVDEGLFLYAHKRVSTFDFEGNRQKPARVIRNGHVEALLKKVLREPDGTPIYSSRANGGLYMATKHQGLLFIDHKFVIYVKTIDRVFVEKFFERLEHWQGCEESEDKIVQKQEERQRRENLIKKQIKDAEAKMAAILDTLNTPGCPKSMKTDLFKKYEGLEKKKAELER